MKTLTEQDWSDAEKKWSPRHNHSGVCNFCEIFTRKSWNRPCHDCIKKGCPLAVESEHNWEICCGGKWYAWNVSRKGRLFNEDNGSQKLASAVLAFIVKKHKEWKKSKSS